MTSSNFTIYRTTIGSSAVSVDINISGTALLGTDYEILSGADSSSATAMTITIPNGQLSKTVVLNTIGPPVTSTKIAIFSIATSASYVGIFPATQTLTISPFTIGDVLDKISVTSSLAYGFRRLRSAYTGPACRVRNGLNNSELNINFLSTGMLDTAQLLNFAGTNSVFVTTIYNQGSAGNTFNMTQPGGANQPQIVVNGILQTRNTRPCMLQSGASNMTIPSLSILGAGNQNFTINYVAGQVGTLNRRILDSLNRFFATNWALGFTNDRYRSFIFNGIGNSTIAPSIAIPAGDNNLRIYSTISNANTTLNASVYENSISYDSANVPSTLPDGNLTSNGKTEDNNGSNCNFLEFISFPQALSLVQLQTIETSQKLYFGIT